METFLLVGGSDRHLTPGAAVSALLAASCVRRVPRGAPDRGSPRAEQSPAAPCSAALGAAEQPYGSLPFLQPQSQTAAIGNKWDELGVPACILPEG